MIKIENVETYGWEAAIRGMRNPMNSWEKSDSEICDVYMAEEYCPKYSRGCPFNNECGNSKYEVNNSQLAHIGPNDHELMMKLRNAGTDHRKFMRMITVYCDITAPLYWWKEFDTYKVGTVANSCSTMHKIADKEFTLNDFSHEHLIDNEDFTCYGGDWFPPLEILNLIIDSLNGVREEYLKTKDKRYWWQMIQLLPSSYNQKRTVMLNYEVLANMYHSRKNHKLDEWQEFCKWIEHLPYSELIIGED